MAGHFIKRLVINAAVVALPVPARRRGTPARPHAVAHFALGNERKFIDGVVSERGLRFHPLQLGKEGDFVAVIEREIVRLVIYAPALSVLCRISPSAGNWSITAVCASPVVPSGNSSEVVAHWVGSLK